MLRSFVAVVAPVVALALAPTVAPTVALAARGAPPVGAEYREPRDERRYPDMSGAAPYQRPGYGYTLPREWMTPVYLIGNYDSYDLPDPAVGFGWSRYYDDAVLTDRYGRVYDVRYDFENVYDRRGRRHRRDRDRDYVSDAQPHWDMAYLDGQSAGYGPDDGDEETVTTTTTTTRTPPRETRTVRYVTRYENVRAPARRGKSVRKRR